MFGVEERIGADYLDLAMDLVPEGPNEGSQAIYCLESVKGKSRPGGHGMTNTPRLLAPDLETPFTSRIIPSLRDGPRYST
jgi:hypothetical protein